MGGLLIAIVIRELTGYGQYISIGIVAACLFYIWQKPNFELAKEVAATMSIGTLDSRTPHTKGSASLRIDDSDEDLYLQILTDVEAGNVQEALWAKILVLHKGDEDKVKYLYVEEMVQRKKAQTGRVHIEHENATVTTQLIAGEGWLDSEEHVPTKSATESDALSADETLWMADEKKGDLGIVFTIVLVATLVVIASANG